MYPCGILRCSIMDECLDWQGRPIADEPSLQLPHVPGKNTSMADQAELQVPAVQRFWLSPSTAEGVERQSTPLRLTITVGGWDRTVTSPTTRLDVILTAPSLWTSWQTRRFASRRTTSTPFWLWHSALRQRVSVCAAHVDHARGSGVCVGQESGCTVTPEHGNKLRCEWFLFSERLPNIR